MGRARNDLRALAAREAITGPNAWHDGAGAVPVCSMARCGNRSRGARFEPTRREGDMTTGSVVQYLDPEVVAVVSEEE